METGVPLTVSKQFYCEVKEISWMPLLDLIKMGNSVNIHHMLEWISFDAGC
jgi:hypothetical protein